MVHKYSRLVSRRSFLGGGVAALGATAAVAIPFGAQGHFYPGTTVSAIDISGKSQTAAEKTLHQHLAGFEQTAVVFKHGEKTWNASLADLGYSVDYTSTLDLAFQRGRDDGLVGRYVTWFNAGNNVQQFSLEFTRDNATLDAYLDTLASDVAIAARDARLVQDGNEIKITPDVAGSALDKDYVRTEIEASVQSATTGTIELSMIPVTASMTAARLTPVKQDAAKLLSGPVTIVNGSSSWTVDEDTLAGALVIPNDPTTEKPSLDPAKLVDAVTDIANSLYVDPVNAIVGWDNGPYAIKLGTYGQSVDPKALASAVADAADQESRTATVPLSDVLPDVRSDNLDTLGLKESLASGDSSFEGSADARATNVQVAAQHVSAALIAPGDQFSFLGSLGPISVDNGYVEGKIILGSWYASDIGGGVCQVSTTVYRAALRAGFEFDEWHPHSFRVSFYELDGWPPGIDATIYQPNTPDEQGLDLKFTNTTGGYLLLQMTVDNQRVTATLYGTSLGLDVEIPDPTVSDPIPPPAPITDPTTTLAIGKKQMLQASTPGYDVVLTRTMSKDGQVVATDTFDSNYQPQAEIWEIGATAEQVAAAGGEPGSGN
ncbi:MAG TPA: VanW family protein [Thermomicrobiales bacterium]|nr:VanW family protein [Thermomicrobiales bacterium]